MAEAEGLLTEKIRNMGGKIKIVPKSILPQVREEWTRVLDRLRDTDMYNGTLKNYFEFCWMRKMTACL